MNFNGLFLLLSSLVFVTCIPHAGEFNAFKNIQCWQVKCLQDPLLCIEVSLELLKLASVYPGHQNLVAGRMEAHQNF